MRIQGTSGCAACGEKFGTLESFDAHQDVDYSRRPAVRCRDPRELKLVPDANGVWQTPAGLARRKALAARFADSRRAHREMTASQDAGVPA